MKKAPVSVLLIAVLIAAALPVSADYYATKQDYLAGKLTPGQPSIPKAGSDTCVGPPVIPPIAGTFNFTDTGNTTGSSNSVAAVPNTCTGTTFDGNASGPDHIWQFHVGNGNSVTFEVTTTSPTYDPMMYVLATCGNGLGSCRIGTDNCLNADLEEAGNPCQGASTERMVHSFNTPGTYYLYVDSWYSAAGAPTQGQGPYTLRVTGTVPVELLKFTVD